jgi:DNA-binding response OmpR family regulator
LRAGSEDAFLGPVCGHEIRKEQGMAKSTHILVVDDDPRVRDMLGRYFEGEGFQVSQADGGESLREQVAGTRFDAILLDLGLPGEDGLTLAREIRSTSSVPIIMITGKGDMVDRVVGLEMGADDYITKPFHLREVLARVRTVLRRSAPQAQEGPGAKSDESAGERLGFAGWQLDLIRRELLSPDGRSVALTTGEFDLLSVFVRHPNRPLNRDQLVDFVHGRDWNPFDRSIDTQVGRLRKKIEQDPKEPELIKTVRGHGYVFTPKIERL